ncbi:MAG: isoprenylcysteine carboxylmethyltransferase family protein [Nanopusillaceae archaeon]
MVDMYHLPFLNQIFFIVWCIILGFGIYKHIINVEKGKVEIKNNIFLAYFLAMYLFSLFFIYYFYYSNIEYLLEAYVAYIGYTIQIIAILFALWTLHSYGKYWAFNLTKFENHKVITTGPNAIVRHPFYLANFLFLLGFSLSLRTLLSILGAFIALAFLMYMIDKEEQFNIENLGEEYREYMKKVKYRLIPFIY